jgi:hypothetical protein
MSNLSSINCFDSHGKGQTDPVIFTSQTHPLQQRVGTVTNNVVYLFGIARSEEELTTVAEMAASVSGVEKVISHVTVRETEDVIHKNT